jgi:hypothetical protein
MKIAIASIPFFLIFVSCNPFAPALDDSLDGTSSVLNGQRNTDSVFQIIKYAYTIRDTSVYGQLFDGNFTFLFQDYDRGVYVSWGRDEEMQTTSGLFRNVQRLDLVWKEVASSSVDSSNTHTMITRGFNLTVTFNPNDIIYVSGYANLTMERQQVEDPWMIVAWRDESNF